MILIFKKLIKWNVAFVCFVQIGHLKKGLNPPSVSELAFGSPYLMTAIKTGIITGVIALAVSSSSSTGFSILTHTYTSNSSPSHAPH